MTAATEYRAAARIQLEMALAMIGTPRDACPECHQPVASGAPHTARSAAIACGINPQTVWRAVRRRRNQAPAQPSQP